MLRLGSLGPVHESARRRFFLGSMLLLLAACGNRPPFVVLTLEAHEALVAPAERLAVGTHSDRLDVRPLEAGTRFPATITVTAAAVGVHPIWVELRDAGDTAIARGSTTARFRRNGTPTARITLTAACDGDDDCNDDVFCNGTETCYLGACLPGTEPCAAPFPCVTIACLEGADTCSLSVDHARCTAGTYCSPSSGCIEGQGCSVASECQDGSVCNGQEQCTEFRCVPGNLPVLDDEDPCTIDGCNDDRVNDGGEPIFHLSTVATDGNRCTLPDESEGICLHTEGKCVASRCGDGYRDVQKDEACDDGDADNADTWSVEPHCNANCSALAPHCGDGTRDADEECDDGDRLDGGNGCSTTCTANNTCGDGVPELAVEQCDDGNNGDACDGCFDSCTTGCTCAPDSCPRSEWCDLGSCQACDTVTHCGPDCDACGGTTPLCGGATLGCICEGDSCGVGARCIDGACSPCDEAGRCGPTCIACSEPTPECGGPEVGCVTFDCGGLPDFTPCEVITTPDRQYDICVGETCVSPGCGDTSCNPPGPSFQLGDTGVTTCYRDSYYTTPCTDPTSCVEWCGQDAQFGWDASNDPADRFTVDAPVPDELIVHDAATGLEWMRCLVGQKGVSCDEGAAAEPGWAEAVTLCDASNWGNQSDWHLPDIYELSSITNFTLEAPALDTVIFPAVGLTQQFWTLSMTDDAPWYVGRFSGGLARSTYVTQGHVRCVRHPAGATRTVGSRFARTTTNTPVVSDATTQLMWQGCPAGITGSLCDTGTASTFDWHGARQWCWDSDWNNASDWRLPSIIELQSIAPPTGEASAIPSLFPGTPDEQGWSSTTAEWQGNAWIIHRVGSWNVVKSATTQIPITRCVRDLP